eukprot:gene16921-biopygen17296
MAETKSSILKELQKKHLVSRITLETDSEPNCKILATLGYWSVILPNTTCHAGARGCGGAGGVQRGNREHRMAPLPPPAQRSLGTYVPLSLYIPWGHRTVARAWRGHGAGVARAIGHCLACVALAWRGHVL